MLCTLALSRPASPPAGVAGQANDPQPNGRQRRPMLLPLPLVWARDAVEALPPLGEVTRPRRSSSVRIAR